MIHEINEPQLPWLQIAICHTGLDVKMEVIQCTGDIAANTRHHQLVQQSCARAVFGLPHKKTNYILDVRLISMDGLILIF